MNWSESIFSNSIAMLQRRIDRETRGGDFQFRPGFDDLLQVITKKTTDVVDYFHRLLQHCSFIAFQFRSVTTWPVLQRALCAYLEQGTQ
jgi:hypothetical protein